MLETLLLIRKAAGPVAPDAVVRELRATPALVRRVIERLAVERLVSPQDDGTVLFAPATPELISLCEKLEVASRERPIALRDAIISNPEMKLRNLADAFRFSQGGEDE